MHTQCIQCSLYACRDIDGDIDDVEMKDDEPYVNVYETPSTVETHYEALD